MLAQKIFKAPCSRPSFQDYVAAAASEGKRSTLEVRTEESWLASMGKKYGETNVKVVQRVLKNL